ncbi:MAG: hypothetical protein ABI083_15695 [Lapillicoccus sp.]
MGAAEAPWPHEWQVVRHPGHRDPDGDDLRHRAPWGRETDWVRNVRAAGRCTIRWKGVDYECSAPTFVDKGVALAAAHGLTRRLVERGSFPHGFIQLDRRAA